MKKRTFLSLLLAMMLYGGLQAKSVDVETAKALGVKFRNANTEIKANVAQLAYTAYSDQGTACFYVNSANYNHDCKEYIMKMTE